MATELELNELQKKINRAIANKSTKKEEWLALWDEYKKCLKTCDSVRGGEFGWKNELFTMIVSCYKDDD